MKVDGRIFCSVFSAERTGFRDIKLWPDGRRLLWQLYEGTLLSSGGVQQPYYNAMLLSGQVPYDAIMEMIEQLWDGS